MEDIMNKIIMVAATLLLLVLIILCKKAYAYLKTLLKKEDAEKLDKFVETLVYAADQMFKDIDPDGSLRLDYVQGQLVEAGHDLTEAVRALIESKVLKLGHGGGAA